MLYLLSNTSSPQLEHTFYVQISIFLNLYFDGMKPNDICCIFMLYICWNFKLT